MFAVFSRFAIYANVVRQTEIYIDQGGTAFDLCDRIAIFFHPRTKMEGRTMRQFFLGAVFTFAMVTRISAQDNCSQCNTPLDKAAYDDTQVDVTHYTNDQIKIDFCSIRDAVDTGSESTGLSALAKSFVASFRTDKSEYHRLYQQFCLNSSFDFTSYDRGIVVSHLVHNESLRVWSHCMDQCWLVSHPGFQSRVSADEGVNFTFQIRWQPAFGVNNVKVNDFVVDGGRCSPPLKGKRLGTEWVPTQCVRNADTVGAGVVYITIVGAGNVGGHSAVILPPPPPAPVYTTKEIEHEATCTHDRKMLTCVPNGGGCLLTDPDNKVIGYFECQSPGPVKRLATEYTCPEHACGWLSRLPGYDLIDNTRKVARFGFKTNSSDSMTITNKYWYTESVQECSQNCATPPKLRVIPNPTNGPKPAPARH